MLESPGSKAEQNFQATGGMLIPNEGQTKIELTGPGGIEMAMIMQIAQNHLSAPVCHQDDGELWVARALQKGWGAGGGQQGSDGGDFRAQGWIVHVHHEVPRSQVQT